jgi:transcriptional regulator
MYIPQHFLETDENKLAALIDRYSFGTLVTTSSGRPFASHVPFIHARAERKLYCHVARANPQWRDLDGTTALVMFQGPHSYISPTWYTAGGVPTWNYVAVHVYGSARAVDDPAHAKRHVEALAALHESGRESPWVPQYDERMLRAIVGIVIDIAEIQGKLKVSQNRSAADRARVIEQLTANGTENELAIASLVPPA